MFVRMSSRAWPEVLFYFYHFCPSRRFVDNGPLHNFTNWIWNAARVFGWSLELL